MSDTGDFIFDKSWNIAKNERFKCGKCGSDCRVEIDGEGTTCWDRWHSSGQHEQDMADDEELEKGFFGEDKAWDIVKNVDFENIRAGEPCYACHMDNAPEMCKGATHSYHGGAGGLFTFCKPQLNKIMQDPTISGDDLSWIEDIREM